MTKNKGNKSGEREIPNKKGHGELEVVNEKRKERGEKEGKNTL